MSHLVIWERIRPPSWLHPHVMYRHMSDVRLRDGGQFRQKQEANSVSLLSRQHFQSVSCLLDGDINVCVLSDSDTRGNFGICCKSGEPMLKEKKRNRESLLGCWAWLAAGALLGFYFFSICDDWIAAARKHLLFARGQSNLTGEMSHDRKWTGIYLM
jgi:hypothetical protein